MLMTSYTTKSLRFIFLTVVAISVSFLFATCVKDTVEKTDRYVIYRPIYKTVQEVRDNIKTVAPIKIELPGKIYTKGTYIFITESNKGIHIIDNSNPSSPKNAGFIEIPYNVDMAVKNNTLYADMAMDLLSIDITDPRNVVLKNVTEKAFSNTGWGPYDGKIVIGYERKDTVVRYKGPVAPPLPVPYDSYYYNLSNGSGTVGQSGPSAPSYGTGGSLSRFAAAKERLYAVGYNSLSVFSITQDNNPSFLVKKDLGWGIETIFPFADKLFVGSMTGVKIFSLDNPDNPSVLGEFGHVRRCDPVVANDKYAFVTLRTGTTCGGNNSELQILSLESLTNPTLIKTYGLGNPYGLAIDGNTLFICDGRFGLKIYDASDLKDLKLTRQISDIEPYDIIAMNGLALVVGKKALYQYDYNDLNNFRLLSSTEITR